MRMEQEQARREFARASVARLATVSEQAQPHLVPVTFVVTGDLITTAVDHKPKRTTELKRLRNITENARVTLLVDHYEEDWSRLWWVRADGAASLADATDHPDLVDALATKYGQYQQQRPAQTLIVIRVHRWTGWAAS
ncbi:TIGR03668 family PPOX class F420-dependent oxidoreductase [Haloactinomyces albus]|uniref:PPOX class probable F420-dependent enzyme n=1 Tax=Haloactinomyces albus TaxID=1352928 RepID=A0AAE4CNU7_9ACTN|nr:TIGR03668 family PPOX class F420-dependent oxidoreductase [Haloactinomyces albus]MDR7302427.1 PPOX class probable F420-dependent enzyme [Haloactinomyces albus]